MQPTKSKLDRASFQMAFKTASLDPAKEYGVMIIVSQPGYVPATVQAVGTAPSTATVFNIRGKGMDIENLEFDANVLRVQAPRPKNPLLSP